MQENSRGMIYPVLLDENFQQLVTVIQYRSLILYEVFRNLGSISLYCQPALFDTAKNRAKYIYLSDDRPLGEIERVEIENGSEWLHIRADLVINKLNKKIISQTQSFFNQTPLQIMTTLLTQYMPDIAIDPESFTGTVIDAIQFTGDTLLDAVWAFCDAQLMDAQMTYSFTGNQLYFSFIDPKDRTQAQSDNPFCQFSLRGGSIADYRWLKETGKYRNYAYIAGEIKEDGTPRVWTSVDLRLTPDEEKLEIFVDARDLRSEDGDLTLTPAQYLAALQQRGLEKLAEYLLAEGAEITPTVGKKIYRQDFGLGDKVDYAIQDIGIFDSFVVNEVDEIWEEGYYHNELICGDLVIVQRTGQQKA